VKAHARGRILGGIAVTMSLAAACGSSRRPATDAAMDTPIMTVDAPVDAAILCSDPARTGQAYVNNDETCDCGDVDVTATFDANGVITSITDPQGNPLPQEIESCLLDILSDYCYPSLAGMTETFMSCHRWIA
jgi:hypothetical protein